MRHRWRQQRVQVCRNYSGRGHCHQRPKSCTELGQAHRHHLLQHLQRLGWQTRLQQEASCRSKLLCECEHMCKDGRLCTPAPINIVLHTPDLQPQQAEGSCAREARGACLP